MWPVSLRQGARPPGGTVYLCTADSEGNMVSFIQSNYMGFGSGWSSGHRHRPPEPGPQLQPGSHPRQPAGAGQTLLPHDHPRLPYQGRRPIGPFGVMGGFMQPQGHMQVVMNMVDFGLNPQAALDAPRWRWKEKNVVEVGTGFIDRQARP